MSERRVVSLVVVRAIVRAAVAAGCDAAELLSEVGLTDRDLAPPDEFIPAELEELLWTEACRRVGTPDFGLKAALTLRRGDFRALEYLCRTSATLGAALASLVRFQRFLHGAELYELHTTADGVTLEYRSPHSDEFGCRAVAAEFALAALLVLGRDASGKSWAPAGVRLRRAPPAESGPHEQVFRAPIRFGQDRCAMDLSADTLAAPMRDADPVLCSIMEGCVQRALPPPAPSPLDLSQRVRDELTAALPRGDATAERISEQLGMKRRALQKQLAALGTAFQEILDETRLSLAREYLGRPDLSVPGIALLLGYSDVTAFHRAFRRWTGQTPGAYRRSLGSPSGQ